MGPSGWPLKIVFNGLCASLYLFFVILPNFESAQFKVFRAPPEPLTMESKIRQYGFWLLLLVGCGRESNHIPLHSSQIGSMLLEGDLGPKFELIIAESSKKNPKFVEGFIVLEGPTSGESCRAKIQFPSREQSVETTPVAHPPESGAIFRFQEKLPVELSKSFAAIIVTCWSTSGSYSRQSMQISPQG